MARPKKFGEATERYSTRLPNSKRDEIIKQFEEILDKYIKKNGSV